uniref:FRIGIDA-like protein n=1 Tax=Acrobeloides nanus TaxID=290746 RepID=A0A914CEL3_9BILA
MSCGIQEHRVLLQVITNHKRRQRDYEQELKTLRCQKKALEQKLQEASNQDAPSSSQIKELCRQNEELQRKNEELAIENEIFEKRYEAQCKENAKLKMGEIQSNEWEQKYNVMKNEHNEMELLRETAVKENYEMAKDHDKLLNEKKKLLVKVRELENQLQENAVVLKECNKLRNEVQDLKNQLKVKPEEPLKDKKEMILELRKSSDESRVFEFLTKSYKLILKDVREIFSKVQELKNQLKVKTEKPLKDKKEMVLELRKSSDESRVFEFLAKSYKLILKDVREIFSKVFETASDKYRKSTVQRLIGLFVSENRKGYASLQLAFTKMFENGFPTTFEKYSQMMQAENKNGESYDPEVINLMWDGLIMESVKYKLENSHFASILPQTSNAQNLVNIASDPKTSSTSEISNALTPQSSKQPKSILKNKRTSCTLSEDSNENGSNKKPKFDNHDGYCIIIDD